MTSMPTPSQRLPQVPYQGSSDHGRHSSADYNPALGFAPGSGLKVNPSHKPNDVLSHFEVDAFNELAIDNLRFRQRGGDYQLSHRSSP